MDCDVKERFDAIEHVLKMLLVNSVLNENEIVRIGNKIIANAKKLVSPLGFTNFRINYIEKRCYLFADIDPDYSIKEIRNAYFNAIDLLHGIPLVVSFDKLNSRRRQSLELSEISYYELNGGMKIYYSDCSQE